MGGSNRLLRVDQWRLRSFAWVDVEELLALMGKLGMVANGGCGLGNGNWAVVVVAVYFSLLWWIFFPSFYWNFFEVGFY